MEKSLGIKGCIIIFALLINACGGFDDSINVDKLESSITHYDPGIVDFVTDGDDDNHFVYYKNRYYTMGSSTKLYSRRDLRPYGLQPSEYYEDPNNVVGIACDGGSNLFVALYNNYKGKAGHRSNVLYGEREFYYRLPEGYRPSNIVGFAALDGYDNGINDPGCIEPCDEYLIYFDDSNYISCYLKTILSTSNGPILHCHSELYPYTLPKLPDYDPKPTDIAGVGGEGDRDKIHMWFKPHKIHDNRYKGYVIAGSPDDPSDWRRPTKHNNYYYAIK